jgi:hypothetical protein
MAELDSQIPEAAFECPARHEVDAARCPESRDALLTREATSVALTSLGFRVATKTLATKATRGGGPPYSLFSGRALYRWGDALDWARSLLTPPRRSTSEADADRGAR